MKSNNFLSNYSSTRNLKLISMSTLKLPLKIGHIFQTPRPPIPKNWPNDVSKKNAGIPAKKRQMQYGTRNAPEVWKK